MELMENMEGGKIVELNFYLLRKIFVLTCHTDRNRRRRNMSIIKHDYMMIIISAKYYTAFSHS